MLHICITPNPSVHASAIACVHLPTCTGVAFAPLLQRGRWWHPGDAGRRQPHGAPFRVKDHRDRGAAPCARPAIQPLTRIGTQPAHHRTVFLWLAACSLA